MMKMMGCVVDGGGDLLLPVITRPCYFRFSAYLNSLASQIRTPNSPQVLRSPAVSAAAAAAVLTAARLPAAGSVDGRPNVVNLPSTPTTPSCQGI